MPITRRNALAMAAALPLMGFAKERASLTLTLATNLHADGALVRERRLPLVILFSLPGCPHCELVRRSHLIPMQREVPLRAVIRQIDIQSSTRVIGFDRNITTHADFAKAMKVTLTPTVAFYDASGVAIAEPLVGAMLPDFYSSYLDAAVSAATQRLPGPRKQQS